MLETQTLRMLPDGTPFSTRYGDVYHSAAGGLAQARHVFLAGNGLPARWRGRARFVILETGFGLGLNFLATWQAWLADPLACRELCFISLEKHPFAAADLAIAHAAWPELAALAEALRAHWPPLQPGEHRLRLENAAREVREVKVEEKASNTAVPGLARLAGREKWKAGAVPERFVPGVSIAPESSGAPEVGVQAMQADPEAAAALGFAEAPERAGVLANPIARRVELRLIFGDAAALLPEIGLMPDVAVDAFYLDGFSPAKNPALWSPQLCCALAHLAKSGATLATWSVAGSVRRALADAGFVLEKRPGFANKRQMLVGRFP